MTLALLTTLSLVSYAKRFGETLFNVNLIISTPIKIAEVHNLTFGSYEAGLSQMATIAPADAGAAVFQAKGAAGARVVGSITIAAVVMKEGKGGATRQFTLGAWRFGGDMSPSGLATFNKSGELTNLRVGATAQISAGNEPGVYVGKDTFRLTYI